MELGKVFEEMEKDDQVGLAILKDALHINLIYLT
jgi:hypothetical protein